MAKKVFMIAPFEAMTGNLSGAQNLQYAENNNPAYEAPNGTQYARNYKPRYVGARRGSDGLVYFSVRQRNAAVLNGITRTGMGLTAITAAIKSAVMALPATSLGLIPWTHIKNCFDAYKEQNPAASDAKSINTYFDNRVRRMLRFKQATYLFHEPQVAGGWTLHNPYDLASADALVIKLSTWVKFAKLFAFSSTALQTAYITIDGYTLFCAVGAEENFDFSGAKSGGTNPSYQANLNELAVGAEDVTYMSLPVYTWDGTLVVPLTVMTDGEKFTTIAPEP